MLGVDISDDGVYVAVTGYSCKVDVWTLNDGKKAGEPWDIGLPTYKVRFARRDDEEWNLVTGTTNSGLRTRALKSLLK